MSRGFIVPSSTILTCSTIGICDAGLAGQLQDGRDRCQALGRLVHLLHDVLEAVALTEQSARGVVAAERRLAGRDQVAEAREALQRLGVRALGDGEVGHLDETAGDDRRLRVLAVADAVDDADRDGDEVLQHAAELGADHVGVHERAEVSVARPAGDRFGGLLARRGDHGGGGLLAGDLEGEVRTGGDGDAIGIAVQLLLDDLAHPQARAPLDALHERHDRRVRVHDQRSHALEVLPHGLARDRQVHLLGALERLGEVVGGVHLARQVDPGQILAVALGLVDLVARARGGVPTS